MDEEEINLSLEIYEKKREKELRSRKILDSTFFLSGIIIKSVVFSLLLTLLVSSTTSNPALSLSIGFLLVVEYLRSLKW